MARRAWDYYPTPDWATKVVVEKYQMSGTVFEPCVGQGDISKAVEKHSVSTLKLLTNDVNPNVSADWHWDATQPQCWDGLHFDWVVSNPPFTNALEIVQQALKHSTNVLMLLRMSFLEPVGTRAKWLHEHPPRGLVVIPRISFTGDGKTDSVTCAWMYWSNEQREAHIEVIHPVFEQETMV